MACTFGSLKKVGFFLNIIILNLLTWAGQRWFGDFVYRKLGPWGELVVAFYSSYVFYELRKSTKRYHYLFPSDSVTALAVSQPCFEIIISEGKMFHLQWGLTVPALLKVMLTTPLIISCPWNVTVHWFRKVRFIELKISTIKDSSRLEQAVFWQGWKLIYK